RPAHQAASAARPLLSALLAPTRPPAPPISRLAIQHPLATPLVAQPLLAVHAAPFTLASARDMAVRTSTPRAARISARAPTQRLGPAARIAFSSAGTPACALCTHPAPGPANLP